MKRRFVIYFFIIVVIFITIAVLTKPDDRTIKIATINAIWGDKAPRPEDAPQFYEQFMNITTVDIYINDWWLLKRIQYKFAKGTETVGIAAFGKVMIYK